MFEQRDLGFIYRYFIAEKQEAGLIIVAGLAAVVLAVIFFYLIKDHPAFYKGLAVPLATLGLLQVIVGFTVYTRTDKQKAEIAYNIGIAPVDFVKQTELPRMEKVMRSFVIYRWLQIGFIGTGIVLVFLFRQNPERSFWYGLGIALALQGLLLLGADYVAEKRGKVYVEALKEIINKPAATP